MPSIRVDSPNSVNICSILYPNHNPDNLGHGYITASDGNIAACDGNIAACDGNITPYDGNIIWLMGPLGGIPGPRIGRSKQGRHVA